jgi:hypothetical protein
MPKCDAQEEPSQVCKSDRHPAHQIVLVARVMAIAMLQQAMTVRCLGGSLTMSRQVNTKRPMTIHLSTLQQPSVVGPMVIPDSSESLHDNYIL